MPLNCREESHHGAHATWDKGIVGECSCEETDIVPNEARRSSELLTGLSTGPTAGPTTTKTRSSRARSWPGATVPHDVMQGPLCITSRRIGSPERSWTVGKSVESSSGGTNGMKQAKKNAQDAACSDPIEAIRIGFETGRGRVGRPRTTFFNQILGRG